MRVIAGTAKGRRLRTPPGLRVRPTADRVKEALFSILGDRVRDARVLDLYAGAGSLGIEAISRGSCEAVMVESSRTAVSALRANLETTGFFPKARVIEAKVEEALSTLLEKGSAFDLIFMDPPYRISEGELRPVFQGLLERDLLTARSLLILESSSKMSPLDFAGFIIKSVRVYGDTSLIFYTRREAEEGVS